MVLHYTKAMPYEPGSPQCRVLIDCKSQIESMLLALERIEESAGVRDQLRSVHRQLEELHGLYRRPAEASALESAVLEPSAQP
jgi:hypothetical protein